MAFFLLKRASRYGRCFMIDSGSKGCPEQESAGCHFGTLGRNFLRAKTKWPPNISRSNMIFQQMKPWTSVIPHFHVILTGQSISCIILMTQGHLQGQKDNFKVKEAKIPFLQINIGTCVIPLLQWILSENECMVLFCWSKVSFKVESPFQGQKQNGCQIFQGQIWFFNKWS